MAIIYASTILEVTYFPLDFNQMFRSGERYFNFLHIAYHFDLLTPLTDLNARVINNWLLQFYFFVPFGMLIALFQDTLSLKKLFMIVFLTAMILDTSQIVLAFILDAPVGIADIYDVIMNTLGGIIGVLLLKYVLSPFYTKITKGASIYEIKKH
ncbi:VanZ family protein [Erysipelothrix aquatica]|uniref:VanZ family protein n=1 Tax=Erysipelothrix aquatica TaxID=2683714 RepID=UPI00135A890D|nr:VanZ family protein [Erysipelothrix aquatica]